MYRRKETSMLSICHSAFPAIAIYTSEERLKHNYVMMKGTRITNVSRMEQQMNINGKFSFIKFILKLYILSFQVFSESSFLWRKDDGRKQLYFHLIHCLFLHQSLYVHISLIIQIFIQFENNL